MDPLSFTASLITVIGTVKQVKKGLGQLKGLHNAPRELDDLLDENSQFEAILKAIDKTPWKSNGVGPELQTVLSKAHAKLTDFDALIQYTLTEAGSSSKVDRLQWVRRRREVEELRHDLKDITLRIVSLVGVETNTSVSQISSGQQGLMSTVSQISSGQQELKDQLSAAVSELCHKIEEDRSLQSALTGLLGQFRQTSLMSGSEVDSMSAQNVESSLLQSRNSKHFVGPLGEFQVQRHQTLNICPKDCRCKCHCVHNLALPSLLGIFGRGYAEMTGTSLLGSRCDDRSCRAPSAPHVRVSYILPRWVAMRMILIRYCAPFSSGPEYNLKVARVVRSDNAGYAAVLLGNLDLFKRAIASGDCTPYDVLDFGSYTCSLLEAATVYRALEIILGLIALGVSGQTPIMDLTEATRTFDMVLWDRLIVHVDQDLLHHHLSFHRGRKSQLMRKIDFNELAEDHGFTALHKIVCGIDLRDLDLEIQRHPHDVDKLDRHDRNPLWYAISHRNIHFVRCLLERGANPNLGGGAVMIEAIRLGQSEIAKVLITFGFEFADLNMDTFLEAWKQCDHWYHYDEEIQCRAIDSFVIRHWVDVNKQTTYGMTLLMFLCSRQRSRPDDVAQLIRRGAELELRNSNGETALFCCINGLGRPNPDAFLTLVHAGARLEVRDDTGSTVLHHVVLREYNGEDDLIHLLEAMQDVDVSQFDLDARDKDGYTAFDLLKKRNGITWKSYLTAKRGEWWYYENQDVYCIRHLEPFFHRIQDSQGIPKEQQYPPLAPYLCEQTDDEPVPGAWPL